MLIAGFPAGPLAANCYVLAPRAGGGCVVVDPGQDALPGLDDVLGRHHLNPVAVLLTHGHLDHIASAAAVGGPRRGESGGAAGRIPTYIHDADEYMLSDPMAALSAELRAGFAQFLPPGMDLTALRPAAVESLAGVGELTLAGLVISVDHTPGHTGGSVVYRIAAGADTPEILLTGDTLFAGSIGRTDLPGGSTHQLLDSIAGGLLTRPDDAVVLPGHGPSSTIGAERSGNPFLSPRAAR